MSDTSFSCATCGAKSCLQPDKSYPQGCMTVKAQETNLLADALHEFKANAQSHAIAKAAAVVEAKHYCKATRVEEIVHFAKAMDYKKIGIANCIGLMKEAQLFAKILQSAGLIPCGTACKVGRVDKPEIGIPEENKIRPGCFESMCNPILQAKLLNEEKTDFNVIIGLCVGHDSLFIKYAEAPITTLITKDRVMAHNPVGALYTLDAYYGSLLKL